MLKWMAAGAAAAVLPGVRPVRAAEPQPLLPEPPGVDTWELYGRAIHTVAVYKEASTSSERQGAYYRDESFPIVGEVRAPFSAHNDLWYQIPEGYVHSAWVLPIRVYPDQPFIADVGPWGFWGEVAHISTRARTAPGPNAPVRYTFYGGTVYRVLDAALDEAGNGWYKVFDDYPPRQSTNHQWVPAVDVRRIPRVEMSPIHPFVGNKRIEVDLAAQLLSCFEGDDVVFTTLVASGIGGLSTPRGEHHVLLKQASRHMSNVPYEGMSQVEVSSGDIFDLPGVPWNVFFDLLGTAIHGAYWHNDFGIPRSHGCLNVSIDAARWIYRWVHPVGGYEDDFIQSDRRVGTPVVVF